ncbi:MAG: hypothetical protein PHV18_14535 [Lachnospiraceae bacterium]|nr:hypothetical protein [Lachnospiraceae bacterium]
MDVTDVGDAMAAALAAMNAGTSAIGFGRLTAQGSLPATGKALRTAAAQQTLPVDAEPAPDVAADVALAVDVAAALTVGVAAALTVGVEADAKRPQ